MGVATSAPFVVPTGYMAILRGFMFTGDPILNLDFSDVLVTILIDGIPQANYENLELGEQQFDFFIPCHILANDGQRIELRFDNSAAAPGVSVDVSIVFHGNLLLRTGVPIEYEQGNPTKSKAIARGSARRRFGAGRAVGRIRARGRPARARRRRVTRIPWVSFAERRRRDIRRHRARRAGRRS